MSDPQPHDPAPPREPDANDSATEASLRGLAGRPGHNPPSLGPSSDTPDPADGSVVWRPRQGLGVKLAAWVILALIALGLAAMLALLIMANRGR
ncbi:MAG: hypothetical protein IT441_05095 [Phycisphaeraceae bacterium]|nr:hypothetical protein [Phycisphaeraceae bacterium]